MWKSPPVKEYIHPCEPTLKELQKILKELYKAESTNENIQKIKAVESQIDRHTAAGEK